MPDPASVKGAEFIRSIRKLGRARGVTVAFREERGKGSHGTLYYGSRFTVVKDRKQELSRALLSAMLSQLGLTLNDLR